MTLDTSRGKFTSMRHKSKKLPAQVHKSRKLPAQVCAAIYEAGRLGLYVLFDSGVCHVYSKDTGREIGGWEPKKGNYWRDRHKGHTFDGIDAMRRIRALEKR